MSKVKQVSRRRHAKAAPAPETVPPASGARERGAEKLPPLSDIDIIADALAGQIDQCEAEGSHAETKALAAMESLGRVKERLQGPLLSGVPRVNIALALGSVREHVLGVQRILNELALERSAIDCDDPSAVLDGLWHLENFAKIGDRLLAIEGVVARLMKPEAA